MLLRRAGALAGAMLAGAAAGAILAAPGALAADHAVVLRGMPSSFRAGGSPGAVTIAVTSKRKSACVLVRRTLAIRLAGLAADRVRVERAIGGGWRPMAAQATGDGVRVADESPDPTPLCRGRTAAARYRVTFLSGAPAGEATFVAQAFSAHGVLLGRDTATRRVTAPRAAAPSPTPTPTGEPTPSAEPSPESTEQMAAVEPAPAPAAASDGSGPGLGVMIIGLGLLMVGIGAALLVLLVRRNGRDHEDGDGGNGGNGGNGGDRTLLMPTVRG